MNAGDRDPARRPRLAQQGMVHRDYLEHYPHWNSDCLPSLDEFFFGTEEACWALLSGCLFTVHSDAYVVYSDPEPAGEHTWKVGVGLYYA